MPQAILISYQRGLPRAMPQAILIYPRWGLPGAMPRWGLPGAMPRWGLPGRYTGFINVAPLGLTWGGAPGYINIVPLGLARGGAPRILVSQKVQFVPILSISRVAKIQLRKAEFCGFSFADF